MVLYRDWIATAVDHGVLELIKTMYFDISEVAIECDCMI